MSAELNLDVTSPIEMDVDLDTLFDMSLTVLRLSKNLEKLPSAAIEILDRQPKGLSTGLRRVVIGGALFESGQGYEFWDELSKIQENKTLRKIVE